MMQNGRSEESNPAASVEAAQSSGDAKSSHVCIGDKQNVIPYTTFSSCALALQDFLRHDVSLIAGRHVGSS